MYRDVVTAEWNSAPTESLTRFESEVFDEDSLEHNVLTRAIMPTVNAALAKARRVLKMSSAFDLNFGRSGRCFQPSWVRIKPDWALCSEAHKASEAPGRYQNLLPGDTKPSIKWNSTGYSYDHRQWRGPVCQILHYCDSTKRRYGFIVTDAEVVVFRCSREVIESGRALARPPRTMVSPGHYRDVSGSSAMSALSDSMQRASLGPVSSPYQPTETGNEYHPLEYQAIPWANCGDGKRQLTVRLSLLYLALMAGYGPSNIQSEYPSMDSWCLFETGVYAHNTTGETTKKRPSGAKIEYYDPSAAGAVWEMVGGERCLTRSSAYTLPVDRRENMYYYYDHDSGERVFLTEGHTVYDQHRNEFGFFRGLLWVTFAEKELEDERRERDSARKRRKK